MWSNKENAVVQAAALLQALIAALQAVLLLCWRHGVGWTGTFCAVQNRSSPKIRRNESHVWLNMNIYVLSRRKKTRVQESGINNAEKTDYVCEMWKSIIKIEIFLRAPGRRHHLKQLYRTLPTCALFAGTDCSLSGLFLFVRLEVTDTVLSCCDGWHFYLESPTWTNWVNIIPLHAKSEYVIAYSWSMQYSVYLFIYQVYDKMQTKAVATTLDKMFFMNHKWAWNSDPQENVRHFCPKSLAKQFRDTVKVTKILNIEASS